MIFELYLVEDPRMVRILLSVCKQWYQIVCASPQLWRHIRVEFANEWDIESISESTNRYVDACLKHSGSIMWELQLDFSQVITVRDHIIAEIQGSLEEFFSWEGRQAFIEWANRLDTNELEYQWAVLDPDGPHNLWNMPSGHLDYAYEVISKLAGEDGSRMIRWGSLTLQFPEDNYGLAKEIWENFIYPAPKVTRMVATGFRYDFPHQVNTDLLAFPDLPALKHLDMQDVPDRRCFITATSSLESIVLHGGVENWTSTFLSAFARLKTLELVKGHCNWHLDPTQSTVSLPELRQLILRGSFQCLWKIEFIVPKLKFLDIIQNFPASEIMLPKVQPFHVRLEVEDWRFCRNSKALRSQLRGILLQYPSAECLTCPTFLRNCFITVAKELKKKGKLSSALKTIIFKGDEGSSDEEDT
jgi:hypothetical protein